MNNAASRKELFVLTGFAALGCTLIYIIALIIHMLIKTSNDAAMAMAIVIATTLFALFIRSRLGKRLRRRQLALPAPATAPEIQAN